MTNLDREFIDRLSELETPEEIQAALREKGIDEEIPQLAEDFQLLVAVSQGVEISDEYAEKIVGGSSFTPIFEALKYLGDVIDPMMKICDVLNKAADAFNGKITKPVTKPKKNPFNR